MTALEEVRAQKNKSEELIGAIEKASQDMLEAARVGNWDHVVKLEGACALLIAQLKNATTQFITASAKKGQQPILVFEFHPGETAAGASEFGASRTLSRFISRELAGAETRVACNGDPDEVGVAHDAIGRIELHPARSR